MLKVCINPASKVEILFRCANCVVSFRPGWELFAETIEFLGGNVAGARSLRTLPLNDLLWGTERDEDRFLQKGSEPPAQVIESDNSKNATNNVE